LKFSVIIRRRRARAAGRFRTPASHSASRNRLEVSFRALARADLIGVQRLLVHGLDISAQSGADKHKAVDPCRVLECEVGGDDAAERQPDHGGPIDLQKIEKRAKILDVRELGRRRIGFPVASQIVAHHPEPLRQRRHLIVPLPAVHQAAVHEDEGRAAPRGFVVQASSVHRGKTRIRRHVRYPRSRRLADGRREHQRRQRKNAGLHRHRPGE
jgi:hypothetical protein